MIMKDNKYEMTCSFVPICCKGKHEENRGKPKPKALKLKAYRKPCENAIAICEQKLNKT